MPPRMHARLSRTAETAAGKEDMKEIQVIQRPEEAKLLEMDVFSWSIWEKEISEFPWHYDTQETCYVLEGEVTVTPEGGDPVVIAEGDLAIFPEGMDCRWKITRPIRKHYTFA
jgi:uncharacterized cupin superfamily protein